MSVQSLLLSSSAALLVGMAGLVPNLPTPVAAQTTTSEEVGISVYRTANPAVVTVQTARGEGSGSIVSPDGLVLTNDHVVRASGGQVRVTTASGKRYTGRVIATNRSVDLALVQLNTRDRLPTIRLGNTKNLAVGQRVFAIGSPFGLSGTLTTGTLSRIDPRGILQTDAAINPGNSGGPLLNARGELIGVNTAILSPSRQGGNVGIGFATSVEIARQFIQTAQANRNRPGSGSVATTPAPRQQVRLGVVIDENLAIQDIQAGSLADRIGLRPGDRILAANGQRLVEPTQLVEVLNTNSDVVLTIARNRRLANVRIRL